MTRDAAVGLGALTGEPMMTIGITAAIMAHPYTVKSGSDGLIVSQAPDTRKQLALESLMREIKFSQTHRTTGERRRFVVSQFADTECAPKPKRASRRSDLHSAGPIGWHYIAQTRTGAPWTDFCQLDVAADAPDDEVRRNASRDLSRRASDRAQH